MALPANNQLAIADQSLAITPDWESKRDLIKQQFAPKATDDELELFLYVAKKRNLDPLQKQIYCIHRYDKNLNNGKGGFKMAIQTGIDGFRAIADRTGRYAGSDKPYFEGMVGQLGWPAYCRVTVYKVVAGVRCPFEGEARWEEFYPGKEQGFMWHKMPKHMLAKCAEVQALRKAFPNDLSDLRLHEEMMKYGGPEIDPDTGEILDHTHIAPPLRDVNEPDQGDGFLRETTPDRKEERNPFEGEGEIPIVLGFGFREWPRKEWITQPATDQQIRQIAIDCKERNVPEDLRRYAVRAILNSVDTKRYGELRDQPFDEFADDPYSTKNLSKAEACVAITFLKGAPPESISRVITDAEYLKEKCLP